MILSQVIESYKQQIAALQQRLEFSTMMVEHYRKKVEMSVAKSDLLLVNLCSQYVKFSRDVGETSKQIQDISNELHEIEIIKENG